MPLLLLLACTEYTIDPKAEDPAPADDTAAEDTDTAPPIDTAPAEDTAPDETVPSTVPCDDVDLGALQWWGSQPFATEPDPTDGSGRAFYADGFDLVGWSTVALPDSGHNPPGNDRAYRAVLSRPAVERLFVELQSDDGLWLWVNGAPVGQWGGGWQEEGCVNDEANCSETETVAPVEITAFLRDGENVLAARVSNAVAQAYFHLHAYCVEAR